MALKKNEEYVVNKDHVFQFYKQRFPLSQHPNFLQFHYPTIIKKRDRVNRIAIVCERLDDDVTTLRGSII